MDIEVGRDPLAVLGAGGGVFLVVVAAATLAGAPWQHSSGAVVMALQVVGVVLTAAVGIGLAALSTARAGRTSR